MKFRLTYEGEVPSAQSSPGAQKVLMRENFHVQLSALWKKNTTLSNCRTYSQQQPEKFATCGGGMSMMRRDIPNAGMTEMDYAEAIGNNNRRNGFRFVPLVREKEKVCCHLDILFLRNDGITRPVTAGDLDNRVKTIIDALKMPKNPNELSGYSGESDSLFHVLLEDDSLVHGLKVEVDDLLTPPPKVLGRSNQRWSKLLISVEIIPFEVDGFNVHFL